MVSDLPKPVDPFPANCPPLVGFRVDAWRIYFAAVRHASGWRPQDLVVTHWVERATRGAADGCRDVGVVRGGRELARRAIVKAVLAVVLEAPSRDVEAAALADAEGRTTDSRMRKCRWTAEARERTGAGRSVQLVVTGVADVSVDRASARGARNKRKRSECAEPHDKVQCNARAHRRHLHVTATGAAVTKTLVSRIPPTPDCFC